MSTSRLDAIEFCYGIEAGHEVGNDWVPTRIVRFRVTKKTPRRVYYLPENSGGPERPQKQRFVDRQALEQDGQATRKSAGWWEPDLTVYLNPPVIEQAQQPDLGELKAAMAAAHPDRGGSDEEFIATRRRYERARGAQGASLMEEA